MQILLTEYGLTRLTMAGKISSGPKKRAIVDIFEEFGFQQETEDQEKIPNVYGNAAVYGDKDNAVLCSLFIAPGPRNSLVLNLSYRKTPEEILDSYLELPRGEEIKQLIEVMNRLERTALAITFHCTAVWEIEEPNFETIIPLPLIKLTGRNAPFTELSGIRLVKRRKSGVVESVVLDTSGKDSLNASLHFDFRHPLNRQLPAKIKSEAERRIATYVTMASRENH